MTLWDLKTGQFSIIKSIESNDENTLNILMSFGIEPGAEVIFLQKTLFNGPRTFEVNQEKLCSLSFEIANLCKVKTIHE